MAMLLPKPCHSTKLGKMKKGTYAATEGNPNYAEPTGNAATYSAPAVAEYAAPSNEGHQLYTALLQQGGVGYAKSSGTNNISSA